MQSEKHLSTLESELSCEEFVKKLSVLYFESSGWSNAASDSDISVSMAAISVSAKQRRPKGYKTFSMLNLAEHEIYPAHKCKNSINCWHFNIY